MRATKTNQRRSGPSLELFSCFAHFLHSFGRQFAHATRALLTLSSGKQGERFKKHAVHRVVHHCFHPMPLVAQCTVWKKVGSFQHTRLVEGKARCCSLQF